MFDMKKVGERISSLRKKTGMTQMALANKFGISYQAVSNWERGIAMPDISNLKELAEIFDTTVDDILGDEKSADVLLTADDGNVPTASLSADEFNFLSPLLPPDKNLLMLDAVNGYFDENSADEAKTSIDCDGEADDFARRAYEKGNIAMFSLFLRDISDSLRTELCERAFCNGNVAFFSILIKNMPNEAKAEYSKRAFEEGKVASFSILMKFADKLTKKKFMAMAFEEGKLDTFSHLYKEHKNNYLNEEDEIEVAEYAYESNDLPCFCEVVDHLNSKSLSGLFERACRDEKISFVSEMVDYVTHDDIKNGATIAYEIENLEMFAEMVDYMDGETQKYFKKLAISDRRQEFLSELLA